MTLQERELAAIFVQLARDAARDPVDTQALLATLVRTGSRLFGVRGAVAQYAPGGNLPAQFEATDGGLRALVADAVDWQEGPGHDSRTTGCALIDVDLTTHPARVRWPRWVPRAEKLGFARATSLPLHMNGAPAGALVLLGDPGQELDERALAVAHSLVEAAGHTLFLQREIFHSRVLAGQLEHALSSRVVVEQAKGILAARHGLSMEEAFNRLRGHARSHQRKVADVAREIIEGHTDITGA